MRNAYGFVIDALFTLQTSPTITHFNSSLFLPDSSDSQSDGTNSGGEEKSTNTSKSLPSSKSLNNTIKITNSGHSMKIHVDGGNFTTNNGKRMVEVDVDQILKPNVGERPALLPRPPSSLTKPSIMKYRGKQTS